MIDGLGTVTWSGDDEAWFSEVKGCRFSLAYERTSTPVDALADYAREVLKDEDWLSSTLQSAKERAKQEYGEFYSPEIDALSFGRIHLYLHKGRRRIIADLEGGKEDRLWRIEYADRDCEGIGFDR